MKEILLQRIPIYAMSEKTFCGKWESYKTSCINRFQHSGQSAEEAKIGFERLFYPKTVWKYNQIIGYIEILLNDRDVIFEKYMCLKKKKYYYNTTRKCFIQPVYGIGNHFNATKLTNQQIIDKICEWLDNEKKSNKNRYYDLSEFNNIIHYVDIKSIMKNSKE